MTYLWQYKISSNQLKLWQWFDVFVLLMTQQKMVEMVAKLDKFVVYCCQNYFNKFVIKLLVFLTICCISGDFFFLNIYSINFLLGKRAYNDIIVMTRFFQLNSYYLTVLCIFNNKTLVEVRILKLFLP
jgi:hypothetical protein